ncbi:MAG: hypothetical protein LBV45_04180 [Xanthomonadaceae bacterium]|jgi:hypothetical protein|nr:hypothetical protein [Xanthomonadaceae bacterium]
MKLLKPILIVAVVFMLIVVPVMALHVISIVASPKKEVVIYATDNIPLSLADKVAIISPGDKVEVVECMDGKSDLYLRVVTPSGEEGYTFTMGIFVSDMRLSLDSSITPSNLLKCVGFMRTYHRNRSR